MYNTPTFPGIAIYGHSDHETDIAIEFTSKNRSRTCITLPHFPVLPYMVTLITSVAAVPEPVFLKTDRCASNKNVKFVFAAIGF